eukprot:5322884-Pleurochrysis_carterae.AAC.1
MLHDGNFPDLSKLPFSDSVAFTTAVIRFQSRAGFNNIEYRNCMKLRFSVSKIIQKGLEPGQQKVWLKLRSERLLTFCRATVCVVCTLGALDLLRGVLRILGRAHAAHT